MKTKMILGLAVALIVGCTTAKNNDGHLYDTVLEYGTDGMLYNTGTKLNITRWNDTGYRIELQTPAFTYDLTCWVELDTIQKTTAKDAEQDYKHRFNTYLVPQQYVYRGTAKYNNDDRVVMIITAQPLENYLRGETVELEQQDNMSNCIYIFTHNAHRKPNYQCNYTYLFPLNNE